MTDYYLNQLHKTAVISSSVLKQELVFDWQGKSIDLAFKEVLGKKYRNLKVKAVSLNELSPVKDDIFKGDIVIGKLFYRAFLRGGVQGGVWVIDSILKTIEENKNLLELFTRWKEY